MIDTIFLAVALAAWLTALLKARQLRAPERPAGLAWLCLFLLALGCAFIALSPGVERVESVLVPNLGRLLSNVCTMVASAAVLALLLCLTSAPNRVRSRVRLRMATVILACAALAGLFFSASATSPPGVPTGAFGGLVRTEPALNVYVVVYTAYLGAALTELLLLCWRYGRHARRPFLRSGLRVVSGGCLLGLVYLADKLWELLDVWTRPGAASDARCRSAFMPVVHCGLQVGLPAIAVLVILAGVTLPWWAPAAVAPWRFLARHRAHRRLHPLWAALYEVAPEIALTSPSSASDRYGPDATFALHRRVFEIHDGALATLAYRRHEVRDAALAEAEKAGLTGMRLEATVEAAVLAAAIADKRNGARPLAEAAYGDWARADLVDFRHALRWWRLVAREFTRSPVVATVVARTHMAASTGGIR
jgi:hypothetical protein